MEVSSTLEASFGYQFVYPQMVEKVKVRANISESRPSMIVTCNVMHSVRIAESALLLGFGLGVEHDLIAKPATALAWQYHIEMVGRNVIYPAVDVAKIERLFAIAIPIEFARKPSPMQWRVTLACWPKARYMNMRQRHTLVRPTKRRMKIRRSRRWKSDEFHHL